MASFATPQRRPRTPSHFVAAPVADEKRFPAALPNAESPGTERLARASLIPIPLFPAEAPRAEAAPAAVRGMVQARVSVKSVEAGAGGTTPARAGAPLVQRKNATGLPDALKAGVETLSGLALDDVRVHYNSPKAAGLGALAYAQGAEIHVGPGQERHLPHEAWHAVQQKQGRVRPTVQVRGAAVNDDAGLEAEADAMGATAIQMTAMPGTPVPLARPAPLAPGVVQRKPIKDWWAKEKAAFAKLLAGKTDSNQMSASELQAVITFLENDDTGKGRSTDIKDLKAELGLKPKVETTSGSPVSETVVATPEKAITPEPTKPTLRPLPTPNVGGAKMGGTNDGPTIGATLTPPRKEVEKPTPKSIRPTVKKGDEEHEAEGHESDAPKEKEGMLTVRSMPKVNAPVNGKNVFAGPPQYIPITFDGKDYRLKAGQDYLNTEKSAEYMKPDAPIKGAKAQLLRLPANKQTETEADVRVLGDGHHRFVWGAYRGAPVSAEAKVGSTYAEEWSIMKYKPTPENMKMEPIADVGAIKEEFFMAWVSPDPIFVKMQKAGLATFVEELCKHKKLQWTAEAGQELTAHINTRVTQNPDWAFDTVVTKLVSQAVDKERAKEYGRYLLTEATFKSGKKKPAIIFVPATTTGFFNTVLNVVSLDPVKLATADQMLDTLSFETQNARQRSELAAAKVKGGGAHTAAVEYESDRKYVYEALMSVHKVKTIEALVASLKIASPYLVPADYAQTKVAGGVALPDKSVLPDQAARQALWFFKTKGWSESERKSMWGQAPHGEGLASSAAIYGGAAK